MGFATYPRQESKIWSTIARDYGNDDAFIFSILFMLCLFNNFEERKGLKLPCKVGVYLHIDWPTLST